MLIITAIICRVMFRFGNKPIEEGQRIFKLLWIKDLGTVKPKPWTRMQERGYHWRYAVGWMGNFIFFSVGLWYMSATPTPTPTPTPTLALEGWLTSTCISCASRGLTPSPSPNPSPNPNPNPNPDPNPDPNPSPDPTSNQVVHHGAGLHPAHRGTALPLQQQIRRHLQHPPERHRLRHIDVPRLIAISMLLG
jgi:hypothetical protein